MINIFESYKNSSEEEKMNNAIDINKIQKLCKNFNMNYQLSIVHCNV